jgi:hypothetical protein
MPTLRKVREGWGTHLGIRTGEIKAWAARRFSGSARADGFRFV